MSTTLHPSGAGSGSAPSARPALPHAGERRDSGPPRPPAIDLAMIEARADRLGPYVYHDAREDISLLLREVRRLQDQEVAVARLLCLAIGCGVPRRALLFLQDALGELGQRGAS